MTDNEIVKALEDAIKIGDAPIGKYWGCMISKLTAKEAVNLINRQKAEIEMDNVEIKELQRNLNTTLDDVTRARNLYKKSIEELNQAKAEIERLNKFALIRNLGRCEAEIKTEAYREFAKELNNKGMLPHEINDDYAVGLKIIDNCLKRLVGEDDE